uniref:Uncharacterized protein n=1 Tax=Physcomitrium patens TaxID=3218 RepID=A0A2K1J8U3_PHYPA|nr:hypothetical protein PHYPA_021053 [Physcomitrium patens]
MPIEVPVLAVSVGVSLLAPVNVLVPAIEDVPVLVEIEDVLPGGSKRSLIFASKQNLLYLDGILHGDYGFNPSGLMDSEGAAGFHTSKSSTVGLLCSELPEPLHPRFGEELFHNSVIPPMGNYNYWPNLYTMYDVCVRARVDGLCLALTCLLKTTTSSDPWTSNLKF